jgi:phage head maturation protease
MELRYFDMEEIRADEAADGQKRITGLIPYDSRSVDLGGFVEEIKPGAFARSMREGDQVALWSHDTSRPLGATQQGHADA